MHTWAGEQASSSKADYAVSVGFAFGNNNEIYSVKCFNDLQKDQSGERSIM